MTKQGNISIKNDLTAEDFSDTAVKSFIQNINNVSHEIKNQLSILDIYTKILEKKLNDKKILEPVQNSISAIKKQLEELKNINSKKKIALEKKDLKEIIEKEILTYKELLKEKNNSILLIDKTRSKKITALINEDKFGLIAGNIIKNAHEATKNDEIQIIISKIEEKIKIEFVNHGKKIKIENQKKIFESGFTTKKTGWGIGLSACLKDIELQNGKIELTKSDDKETIFTLFIKAA